MPVLICLRKKLWTRTSSTRDQVPTCPVFTRAKIKTPFWDKSKFFASQVKSIKIHGHLNVWKSPNVFVTSSGGLVAFSCYHLPGVWQQVLRMSHLAKETTVSRSGFQKSIHSHWHYQFVQPFAERLDPLSHVTFSKDKCLDRSFLSLIFNTFCFWILLVDFGFHGKNTDFSRSRIGNSWVKT